MTDYEQSETKTDNADIATILFLIGLGLISLGILVLAWQCYTYLKLGQWPTISIITTLEWCNLGWAMNPNPTEWKGLWKLFEGLSLSNNLILFGASLLYVSLKFFCK